MIALRRYPPADSSLWNDFILHSKNGTFLLHRHFMDYHQDRFVDHSLIFLEKEKPLALLPLTEHSNTLISHGGLTYGSLVVGNKIHQKKVLECFESLKNYLIKNRFQKLIYKKIPAIYTAEPCEEDLYALWKLGASLQKQEASSAIFLQGKLPVAELKRRIARAQREGVEWQKSENFTDFVLLLKEVLARHHAHPVHSAEELCLLKKRFPQNIELFTATQNGKMLAASLLFIYPNLVHTQYLAANEKARQIGALDFLISNLIFHYQNQKNYFDFGISTEKHGTFLNEGLIHQKEGFGAHTVCYTTWEWNV